MAGNFESFAGPSYITSRSADVILSDVRPIKLKLEALRSMNVLLDEFLYNILCAANSLSTEKIKAGLHKVLPSTLGKDAVLEAELELKAYWERNTPHTPTSQDFDLQWSFELLRLKCEAYSTMNDTDEDAEVERRLDERMMRAGGTTPPHVSLMAPAALYLTAILEHICQHVLSNVSRVAARDSSRTLATVNDLFVALCEDPSIYPTFKPMKVYGQIEALSKAPRRTKSMSKSSSKSMDRSSHLRASSPSTDIAAREPSLGHRSRVSSESLGPGAVAAAVFAQLGSSRASHERARIKLFSGRSSHDHDRSETPGSFDEDGRSGSFELMDEEAQREFDELMRSSTTMKVSLTPDRLKSMEMFKQERRRKAPALDAENDPVLVISSGGSEVKRAVSARRAHARLVDAITEDDEQSPIKVPPSSPSQAGTLPRTRQKSFTASLAANSLPDVPSPARSRSATISNPQIAKKRSIGQIKPGVPKVPPPILLPSRENATPPESPMQNGRPPRTRKIGRRRESMDLDDIMGGEDDDEVGILSPPRTPASKRGPAKPHISKSARDLIDFLDEGPPPELEPPNLNASMISLDSSRSKSGRLQRMMSKLSLSSSSEKLNGRGSTTSDPRRSPVVNGAPPSSYLPSSAASRQGRTLPSVVVGTPPPPPSAFSPSNAPYSPAPAPTAYSSPVSPPPLFSPSHSIAATLPSSEFPSSLGDNARHEAPPAAFEPARSPSRRTSIARKAVPSLEPTHDRRDSPSPSRLRPIQAVTAAAPAEKPRRKSSSPLDEFPPVPTSVHTPAAARGRNDTMSGKSEMGIGGGVAWAESSSASSVSGTAPPSPSPSLRRPAKQTVSVKLDTTRTPTGPTMNGVNGVHGKLSPSTSSVEVQTIADAPVPEVEKEEKAVAATPAIAGPASAFSFDDAQDMRRMLAAATSADECRLLVDMFLVKSGYPVLTERPEEPVPLAPSPEEDTAKSADMERSLIMHYLGGFDDASVEDEALLVSSGEEPLAA